MRNSITSILLLLAALPGCTTTHFIGQAARGQWGIKQRAIPIRQVLKQNDLSPGTRNLLEKIPRIKAYAESHHLQATDNYETYVEMEGDSAVWVVTACPPLSLHPRTWTFPIAGSFTYLGWFHEKSADKHAAKLSKKGFDVTVRGAEAYSTLGHFQDPIFSSNVNSDTSDESSLANTLFHESAHVTIYIKGQSNFNESVAQFIGDQMTIEYLSETYGNDSVELNTYQKRVKLSAQYTQIFNTAYTALENAYASDNSDAQKRERKDEILTKLHDTFHLQKKLNNADMIGYRTYNSGQKEFQALWERCGKDWGIFMNCLSQLKANDFPKLHLQEYALLLEALTVPE